LLTLSMFLYNRFIEQHRAKSFNAIGKTSP
jgi:hypothetical protein